MDYRRRKLVQDLLKALSGLHFMGVVHGKLSLNAVHLDR